MSAYSNSSPAAKVMDEAIDLAIEGRSPYPERAAFIDADGLLPATRLSVRRMTVSKTGDSRFESWLRRSILLG